MRILLLNGPPRSGKDTLARLLSEELDQTVYRFKFATRLKEMAHRAFGFRWAVADAFEEIKDDPNQGPRHGVSWRRAYIQFSEGFMKPLFGERIFGQLLAEDLRSSVPPNALVTVSDSGFAPEAQVLLENWPGAVRLIHVHRPGTSFAGDSRGYVELDVPKLVVEATSVDQLREIARSGAIKELLL